MSKSALPRAFYGFITACAGMASSAAPFYRAIDLGSLPGYEEYQPVDLNDNGAIIGNARPAAGSPVAFIGTPEKGMQPISSGAAAIKTKGMMAHAEVTAENVEVLTIDRDGSKNFFLDGARADRRITIPTVRSELSSTIYTRRA